MNETDSTDARTGGGEDERMTTTRRTDVHDSVHDLLNTAFEGWGDGAYFRFKYTDFPSYDPDEHLFLARRDGEIVGVRRAFVKHLVIGGATRTVHVHGGAAVHPDYRRRGLFTGLVRESRAYSCERGSPVVVTFNRRGKVSTAAHMERDWAYRTLPLYVRPLSPATLVEEHANAVLPRYGRDRLATVAGLVADRSLPGWGVARATELATSGAVTRPIAVDGHGNSGDEAVSVRPYESADCRAVVALFDSELRQFDLAFARDRAHVEHMTGYDHATSAVAVDEDEVVGFACLGVIDRGEQVEARVFDLVHATPAVESSLLRWVEKTARRRGADAISVLRDDRPGPGWAGLRTDLVMWDRLDDESDLGDRLANDDWRITAYDVL
jgi:predicted N-acetyltransferase YhbS